MSLNVATIRDEGKCTGCAMCEASCPMDVVTMGVVDGFYRPIISEGCTNCGLCFKLCPQNSIEFVTGIKNPTPKDAIAAWSLDESEHFKSSSGGLISVLSKALLHRGYFVACAWFNPVSARVEHKIFDSEKDIYHARGSKYVLSSKSGIYYAVKERLKDTPGLFVGVPCEVAAIKRYLETFGKESMHELYTVDLLCHGGSSPQCLSEHLAKVSRKKKVGSVSFRGGEWDCNLCVYDQNGSMIYSGAQFVDPYFKYFMRHTLFQPACFDCQYTGSDRIGDLTVGDFWGLEESVLELAAGKGTNMVLVNSEAGERMMELVEDEVETHDRPVSEAIQGNDTLRESTPKEAEYDDFWAAINRYGFHRAVRKVYRYNWPLEPRVRKAKGMVYRFIKKLFS